MDALYERYLTKNTEDSIRCESILAEIPQLNLCVEDKKFLSKMMTDRIKGCSSFKKRLLEWDKLQ